MPRFVLTLSCQDRPSIVASVTRELALIGANINESAQFGDPDTGHFFMRIAFEAPVGRGAVQSALADTAERFAMQFAVHDTAKPRILIMVSRFDHAMLHLLYQIRVGWLGADVAAIVSNHETSRRTAELEDIPFHYIPVSASNKAEAEARLLGLIDETGAELVVLARYMQVLSDETSKILSGRIINIHHSFLPSFKGARPYHQAHERGVKLIGATAHYVTAELDEGPIIEQETQRVTHAMSAEDLVATGRDIESRVLARAVKLHCENRVMQNGRKTIVFN